MAFFQSTQAQPDFGEVDGLLKQHQKTLGKDIVVLVQQGTKTVYQRETEALGLKTQHSIGSLSQWFTAAVVMIMVDEGKIALDDRVSKYLPIFETYMKGYITIRQCLNHTTGIESEAGIRTILDRNRYPSLEAQVNAIVSKKDILDNPGQAFSYGYIGPSIAARVLEAVTRKSFDKIASEKLFRPLGMKQTSFYTENGQIDPSGGAKSSAMDLKLFFQMLLQNGNHNGRQILSAAAINEMQQNQIKDLRVRSKPSFTSDYGYGLGVWLQQPGADGRSNTIGVPGMSGAFAWIHKGKDYFGLILFDRNLSEDKMGIPFQIMEAVDGQIQ